jgi:hypothetical protein
MPWPLFPYLRDVRPLPRTIRSLPHQAHACITCARLPVHAGRLCAGGSPDCILEGAHGWIILTAGSAHKRLMDDGTRAQIVTGFSEKGNLFVGMGVVGSGQVTSNLNLKGLLEEEG